MQNERTRLAQLEEWTAQLGVARRDLEGNVLNVRAQINERYEHLRRVLGARKKKLEQQVAKFQQDNDLVLSSLSSLVQREERLLLASASASASTQEKGEEKRIKRRRRRRSTKPETQSQQSKSESKPKPRFLRLSQEKLEETLETIPILSFLDGFLKIGKLTKMFPASARNCVVTGKGTLFVVPGLPLHLCVEIRDHKNDPTSLVPFPLLLTLTSEQIKHEFRAARNDGCLVSSSRSLFTFSSSLPSCFPLSLMSAAEGSPEEERGKEEGREREARKESPEEKEEQEKIDKENPDTCEMKIRLGSRLILAQQVQILRPILGGEQRMTCWDLLAPIVDLAISPSLGLCFCLYDDHFEARDAKSGQVLRRTSLPPIRRGEKSFRSSCVWNEKTQKLYVCTATGDGRNLITFDASGSTLRVYQVFPQMCISGSRIHALPPTALPPTGRVTCTFAPAATDECLENVGFGSGRPNYPFTTMKALGGSAKPEKFYSSSGTSVFEEVGEEREGKATRHVLCQTSEEVNALWADEPGNLLYYVLPKSRSIGVVSLTPQHNVNGEVHRWALPPIATSHDTFHVGPTGPPGGTRTRPNRRSVAEPRWRIALGGSKLYACQEGESKVWIYH